MPTIAPTNAERITVKMSNTRFIVPTLKKVNAIPEEKDQFDKNPHYQNDYAVLSGIGQKKPPVLANQGLPKPNPKPSPD
jgi:hypothetical protein